MSKIVEVCVDNFESAVCAIEAGANRLELCSALSEGGLTPTPGALKQIKLKYERVKVFCMLRCRCSNYVYTQEELNIMMDDAKVLKTFGADGFVFGALLENNDIDLRACREIIKTCYPLPVTFHRAFDMCRVPLIQLESVIDVGFARILTSGQKKTAEEGIPLLKRLIKRANQRIIIVPGGGITKDNINLLIEETEAIEYHGSFRTTKPPIEQKSELELETLKVTDSEHLSEIVQILKQS